MLASGHTRTAALTSAIIVAAATIAGVLVINLFPGWVRVGLPVAAGVAIYVTATDLVPEVNREPGIRMALVFFGGVAAFLITKFVADGVLR
jgi:ZIP family zinc transporter/zinc and cadmium transporter